MTPTGDIQRMLGEIQRSVGRIEGQTAAFIEQMKVQDDRTTKIEGRTRALEKWQGFYAGIGTVIGVILGALGIHFRSGVS